LYIKIFSKEVISGEGQVRGWLRDILDLNSKNERRIKKS
jgi:hypothetical protein